MEQLYEGRELKVGEKVKIFTSKNKYIGIGLYDGLEPMEDENGKKIFDCPRFVIKNKTYYGFEIFWIPCLEASKYDKTD